MEEYYVALIAVSRPVTRLSRGVLNLAWSHKCTGPVKTLLQDFPRKGPFFVHSYKILQDLAIYCRNARKRTFS